MIKKITSNTFQFYFPKFGSTVYLLQLDDQNILIDTSSEDNKKELLDNLKQLNLNPEDINIILLTHNHWDHNGNVGLFKNAKIYSYKNINQLSLKQIRTIKVPGHTCDSLAFLYEDVLFSGDTLFYNGIGRTDLPESVPEKMQESLDALKNISYKILCPGHV